MTEVLFVFAWEVDVSFFATKKLGGDGDVDGMVQLRCCTACFANPVLVP